MTTWRKRFSVEYKFGKNKEMMEEKHFMYKIDWFIKSYVYGNFQRIWGKIWLTKHSNVNDENNLHTRIKQVVVGFHNKYPPQNHYAWFLLIARLELRKPRKSEYAAFDFDIYIYGPISAT